MFALYLIIQIILVLILIITAIQFYDIVFRGFAPFISTKSKAILLIIKELNLSGKEKVYELGAGKAGFLRAVEQKFKNSDLLGIEKSWWPYFLAKIQLSLVGSRIKILRKDFFKVNLKEADIIYCFLNIKSMRKLAKKFLEECRPGTLIISYHFKIPGLETERVLKEGKNNIFFYRI